MIVEILVGVLLGVVFASPMFIILFVVMNWCNKNVSKNEHHWCNAEGSMYP